MSHILSELDRRLGNLVRQGVIKELDAKNARVKVDLGDVTTDWLPWGASRAGATRTWSAPRPGEQVMVISPSGELSAGVVQSSIFQDDHAAPADSQDVDHTVYPDGSTVDYNSATNTLTVTVAAAGNVVINCQNATVNAATKVELSTPLVHCTQALTVDGVITGKGGMAISGGSGATINGNLAAEGGTFSHNGKNVGSTHTHANSGGSGTGGAPT